MRSLTAPNFDPMDVFFDCVNNISDVQKRDLFLANTTNIEQAVTDYINASHTKTWCTLTRTPRGNSNNIVTGSLSKKALVDLYSKNMVASTGPARTRYDEILAAANGKCPFCGGIGHTKTLDHYLPKSNYPLYSVLPKNLVPCCRDCNTGRGSTFASNAENQTIHPYLDEQHFFTEKWVIGTISRTNPITIRFSAAPPEHWNPTDVQRAISHFETYGLAERYSIEAAGGLSGLIDQRRNYLQTTSPEEFKNYLADIANSPSYPINGWTRVMHSALAESDWFCLQTF